MGDWLFKIQRYLLLHMTATSTKIQTIDKYLNSDPFFPGRKTCLKRLLFYSLYIGIIYTLFLSGSTSDAYIFCRCFSLLKSNNWNNGISVVISSESQTDKSCFQGNSLKLSRLILHGITNN